jgi:hypothetical protein
MNYNTIFWRLALNDPATLQKLDDYQVKHHRCHIQVPTAPSGKNTVMGVIESKEEIAREMAKAPSRSRGDY